MGDRTAIFIGDGAWRVVTVGAGASEGPPGPVRLDGLAPVEEGSTLEARAQAAAQQLAAGGDASRPFVLAPASPWCLSAAIATDNLERGGRRQAMGFRLEEHLPISAEEVVADYVETGAGEALGVCGELEKLATVVRAFEAAGLEVRHISPAALLAAAYAAERHPGAGAVLVLGGKPEGQDDAHAALPQGGWHGHPAHDSRAGSPCHLGKAPVATCDLVELHRGKPVRWWWFADDGQAARDRIAAWEAGQDPPAPLVVLGDRRPDPALLEGRASPVFEDTSADQAAAQQAAAVLAGAASPWIDLRRDALAAPNPYHVYRKPLGALAAAAVLLLVSISGAMQWRGRQYQALGRRNLRQQAEVFKAALPDQRVPPSIKGRLASEKRRLEGIGGQAAGEALAAVQPTSALTQLRDVLAGLPSDVRYRILDLAIQPDLVRLDGQARGHAEADRLAAALRQSGRFEVEPPKTQLLREGGVSFLFTAKPRAGQAKGAP